MTILPYFPSVTCSHDKSKTLSMGTQNDMLRAKKGSFSMAPCFDTFMDLNGLAKKN